jgi:hypothetical protein
MEFAHFSPPPGVAITAEFAIFSFPPLRSACRGKMR